MTQCNRKRRMRAWSAALLIAAAGTFTACGGSSATHKDPAQTNASANSPSGTATTTSTGTTATPGATGGTKAGSTNNGAASAPGARASNFVTCMRANGVALPAPVKTGSGATLDFKGINTSSPGYKRAVSTCARQLLGKFHVTAGKGHEHVRLAQIHITGIKLKSLHIGHIELGNIHVPSIKTGTVNAPPVHVNAPAPNLGGQAGGEPPTRPKSAGEPEA